MPLYQLGLSVKKDKLSIVRAWSGHSLTLERIVNSNLRSKHWQVILFVW